ncbi:hypothetical protein ONZ51_g12322 [Trametes cubensis]|uniref:F-box domain-containing protein n=1 Tax=Trametes cubensis TaxID=1111947 RepID=A0AAD7TFX7_9APHY|nr:hypothetical protein ONZ51_g12322 [Trametes cubensis]
MPAALPQDVCQRVIDLITDRETLCSCALTCREWLPASRYNLFYRTSIAGRTAFDALVSIRTAPHIASALENIHSLQLWEDKERPWLHLFPLIFSPRYLRRTFFLTLGEYIWDSYPLPRSFFLVCTQFDSVTTLKLSDGNFYSFSEFRKVVCAFKRLSRLFVDNVGWRISSRCTQFSWSSPVPHLQLLWFNPARKGAAEPLIEWLLCTPSMETLSDVQIREEDGNDLPAIQSLANRLGSNLIHFQLSLRFWTRDNRVGLSNNPSLRTLHIRDIDAESGQYLPYLLGQLSPSNLMHLTLYLRIPGLVELETLKSHWAEVADILSRDDFLPLQMVTIWLLKVPPSSVTTIPNLVDEIRNWMPALDARSVLRVTPWMFLAN